MDNKKDTDFKFTVDKNPPNRHTKHWVLQTTTDTYSVTDAEKQILDIIRENSSMSHISEVNEKQGNSTATDFIRKLAKKGLIAQYKRPGLRALYCTVTYGEPHIVPDGYEIYKKGLKQHKACKKKYPAAAARNRPNTRPKSQFG